jgi:hypothetical protein
MAPLTLAEVRSRIHIQSFQHENRGGDGSPPGSLVSQDQRRDRPSPPLWFLSPSPSSFWREQTRGRD